MTTQTEIAASIEQLIPAALREKYAHLSYAEMADQPELAEYRDELLQADDDWFAADDAA